MVRAPGLQHLADSELVGGFRFRMVLAHDRPRHPGYDQDRWAERLRYQDNDPATSIADFTALRRMNLGCCSNAPPPPTSPAWPSTPNGARNRWPTCSGCTRDTTWCIGGR
ncbi:MAG: hypothetical protein IPI92_10005 [Gemmatimonadetes bacterium]|nr:hypothetical protein [Gemmatimonadota bacterium]